MALSTIGTAAIADDAITSAKVDSTTAAFTVADLVVTNGITAGAGITAATSINAGTELVGNVSGRILLDGSSVATVTVNSAVSASATIVVDGVSGTIAVGMVVNVSDTTVRSISDAASQTAVSVDDTLTITAVASQTSFTVSEAVTIADNVVLILRANESENFVLDASAASTDVGEKIQFEEGTDDPNTVLDNNLNLNNVAAVKSGGGAVSTNIAQGLAKSWTHFELAGTASVRDSFNHASFTDNATGDATIAITAAMANTNFVHLGMGGHDATSLIAACQQRNAHAPSTTVSRYQLAYADGSLHDSFYAAVALLGELA